MPRKTKTAIEQIKAAKGKKPLKYKNEPHIYNEVRYHSTLEVRFAKWLDLRMGRICPECRGTGTARSIKFDAPTEFYCTHCEGAGRVGGDVLSWERQVKFDLCAFHHVPDKSRIGGFAYVGKDVGTYTIDFVVHFEKHTEYLEVKGWDEKKKKHPTLTPESKLKIAIFRSNNPEKKFRIVDERDLPKGF